MSRCCESSTTTLERGDPFRQRTSTEVSVQTIIEAFRASAGNIAIIDCTGRIIATNRGWLTFARQHGGRFRKTGPGTNYLKVCQGAMQQGNHEAAVALNGIIRVLDGSLPRFCFRYRCFNGGEEFWFEMIVVPLCRREGGAIITHLQIARGHQVDESQNRTAGKQQVLDDGLASGFNANADQARARRTFG